MMSCILLPRVLLLTIAFALASLSATSAQTNNRFALGAEFGARDPVSNQATGGSGMGLIWRIGHHKTGWDWDWGLNWYGIDVTTPIGGTPTHLGKLHVRPIMVGYGYTHVIKRVAVYGELIGGYAFASLGPSTAATDAYRDRLGVHSVSVDVSNPWVVKPEVGMWFDVTDRFGVKVSVRYIVARPTITVHSSDRDDVLPFRADTFTWKAGLVYSIF